MQSQQRRRHLQNGRLRRHAPSIAMLCILSVGTFCSQPAFLHSQMLRYAKLGVGPKLAVDIIFGVLDLDFVCAN